MTQQAELLNKIDKIPSKYFGEVIDEMERKSPTLHKLAGILHTDMTLEEIRMSRLAKHL